MKRSMILAAMCMVAVLAQAGPEWEKGFDEPVLNTHQLNVRDFKGIVSINGSRILTTNGMVYVHSNLVVMGATTMSGGMTVSGNLSGANVSTTGKVSGSVVAFTSATGGTVTASGAIAGLSVGFTTATGGTVTASGTVSGANVSSTGLVSGSVVGFTSATGGTVTASGNVSGANLSTTGAVSASSVGFTTATGGTITASGAITGSSVGFTSATGGTVTVSGTVSGANLSTTGDVSGSSVSFTTATGGTVTASGTISGANLSTTGQVSGSVVGFTSATGGTITATGTIGFTTATGTTVTATTLQGSLLSTYLSGTLCASMPVSATYSSTTNAQVSFQAKDPAGASLARATGFEFWFSTRAVTTTASTNDIESFSVANGDMRMYRDAGASPSYIAQTDTAGLFRFNAVGITNGTSVLTNYVHLLAPNGYYTNYPLVWQP